MYAFFGKNIGCFVKGKLACTKSVLRYSRCKIPRYVAAPLFRLSTNTPTLVHLFKLLLNVVELLEFPVYEAC